MSSFILSTHHSLGLPLFLFPSNLARSALCGIRSTTILSTCPNHQSLCWMTLSSRVVWLHSACLMSSLLIFCSLEIPAIFRSQLISAVRILFSSSFHIVQHYDPYRKTGGLVYFYLGFLCYFFALPYPGHHSKCLGSAFNSSWYVFFVAAICIY